MLPAFAALLSGCADLSLEADLVPTEMAIVPDGHRIVQGDTTRLRVVVSDQDGEEMPVPSWAAPVWKVADGSAARVGPDGTLEATKGGWVDVSARVAGLTADARYCASPARAAVTAPVIYPTQGAQGPKNTVPLIAGRPALLRIFLVADQAEDLEIEVRVTLLQGDEPVFERLLVRDGVASQVDESDLSNSLNVEIPDSAVQPGVGLVVEIDPKCAAPLDPASVTRYPDSASMELRVVKPQLFRQVFVPTLEIGSPDYSVFDWLDGIGPDSEQMRYARNLLPVSEIEVEVHDTLWTSADLGTEEGWRQWINEIRVLNLQEGRRGYYYGAVGSTSFEAYGFAHFNAPWSVGISDSRIYTHEVGHNMDLAHAECGGAGRDDPDYPYGEASIGIWGYDFEAGTLVNPTEHKDFMSYCDPAWVSDYHFGRALAHRLNGDAGVDLNGGSDARRATMLVVWGSVHDGRAKLDPAFLIEGPVELPEADGPYRVVGLGADAETRFSLSFAPTPLDHGGGSTFVYFVPWNPEWASSLDRMVLSGPGGRHTLTRDDGPPLAVLMEPSTGAIQAIVRNWDGGPIPGREGADLSVTRGIPGASR